MTTAVTAVAHEVGQTATPLVDRSGTVATVRLAGEVDGTGAQALGDLLDEILERDGAVVVDLAAVSFIDLRGVAALLAARRRHANAGLIVKNPPRSFDILRRELPGLDRGLVVLHD